VSPLAILRDAELVPRDGVGTVPYAARPGHWALGRAGAAGGSTTPACAAPGPRTRRHPALATS